MSIQVKLIKSPCLSVTPDETKTYRARDRHGNVYIAKFVDRGGTRGWSFESIHGNAFAITPRQTLAGLIEYSLVCCLELVVEEFDCLGDALGGLQR